MKNLLEHPDSNSEFLRLANIPSYIGKVWLAVVAGLNRQKWPVILAVLSATIATPIVRLRSFENFWSKHFWGNPPSWISFSTEVFIAVLCIGLLCLRLYRSSWWSLTYDVQHLREFCVRHGIDEDKYRIVCGYLLTDFVLRRLGEDDPERINQIRMMTEVPAFRRIMCALENNKENGDTERQINKLPSKDGSVIIELKTSQRRSKNVSRSHRSPTFRSNTQNSISKLDRMEKK